MIEKAQLSDLIINSIKEKTETEVIQQRISQVIASYLILNLQVQGSYIGTIPGTPPIPDPLSGAYKFKTMGCLIDKNLLMYSSKININFWYKTILKLIKLTSLFLVKQPNGMITLSSMSPTFSSITPSDIDVSNKKNMQQIWQTISQALVNDIKNAIPTPSLPAISSSGGIGVVSFAKFM